MESPPAESSNSPTGQASITSFLPSNILEESIPETRVTISETTSSTIAPPEALEPVPSPSLIPCSVPEELVPVSPVVIQATIADAAPGGTESGSPSLPVPSQETLSPPSTPSNPDFTLTIPVPSTTSPSAAPSGSEEHMFPDFASELFSGIAVSEPSVEPPNGAEESDCPNPSVSQEVPFTPCSASMGIIPPPPESPSQFDKMGWTSKDTPRFVRGDLIIMRPYTMKDMPDGRIMLHIPLDTAAEMWDTVAPGRIGPHKLLLNRWRLWKATKKREPMEIDTERDEGMYVHLSYGDGSTSKDHEEEQGMVLPANTFVHTVLGRKMWVFRIHAECFLFKDDRAEYFFKKRMLQSVGHVSIYRRPGSLEVPWWSYKIEGTKLNVTYIPINTSLKMWVAGELPVWRSWFLSREHLKHIWTKGQPTAKPDWLEKRVVQIWKRESQETTKPEGFEKNLCDGIYINFTHDQTKYLETEIGFQFLAGMLVFPVVEGEMREVRLCLENFLFENDIGFRRATINRLRGELVEAMDIDELQIDDSEHEETGTKRKYEEDEDTEKELTVERPIKRARIEEDEVEIPQREQNVQSEPVRPSALKKRIEEEGAAENEGMVERPKKRVRLAKLQVDERQQNGKEYRIREKNRHAEDRRQLVEENKWRDENRKRGIAEEHKQRVEESKREAEESNQLVAERLVALAEERKRQVEERKRLAEESMRLAEESTRLAEESKRLAEESKRLAEDRKRQADDHERDITINYKNQLE